MICKIPLSTYRVLVTFFDLIGARDSDSLNLFFSKKEKRPKNFILPKLMAGGGMLELPSSDAIPFRRSKSGTRIGGQLGQMTLH